MICGCGVAGDRGLETAMRLDQAICIRLGDAQRDALGVVRLVRCAAASGGVGGKGGAQEGPFFRAKIDID